MSDPSRALRNVKSLVEAGSRFLFIEHGLSPNPWWRLAQHIVNPAERFFGGGCNLTRDVRRLLVESGLAFRPVDGLFIPETSALIHLTAGQVDHRARILPDLEAG